MNFSRAAKSNLCRPPDHRSTKSIVLQAFVFLTNPGQRTQAPAVAQQGHFYNQPVPRRWPICCPVLIKSTINGPIWNLRQQHIESTPSPAPTDLVSSCASRILFTRVPLAVKVLGLPFRLNITENRSYSLSLERLPSGKQHGIIILRLYSIHRDPQPQTVRVRRPVSITLAACTVPCHPQGRIIGIMGWSHVIVIVTDCLIRRIPLLYCWHCLFHISGKWRSWSLLADIVRDCA